MITSVKLTIIILNGVSAAHLGLLPFFFVFFFSFSRSSLLAASSFFALLSRLPSSADVRLREEALLVFVLLLCLAATSRRVSRLEMPSLGP